MFATSVLYPIDLAGGRLAPLLRLNPMVAIIDAFRAVVIRGVAPDPAPLAAAAVLSVVALAVAWIAFHRAEFRFAENI
jgi:ABC-type polysaccharide/polyol phosphate export permease